MYGDTDYYIDFEYVQAQVYKIKVEVNAYISSNKKLLKETRGIRAQITRYIYDNINRLEQTLDADLVGYLENPTDSTARSSFYDALLHYVSLVMDTYTLGRIFKTFDTTNNPAHPVTANNSIVYVGDAHAEEYCKFISTYMGVQPVVSIRSDNQLLYFSERDRGYSFLFN
jgi:hypothetical protein